MPQHALLLAAVEHRIADAGELGSLDLEERDRLRSMRLEALRAEIQQGLDSGAPTPLDVGAIKARGRKRLAAEQKKA